MLFARCELGPGRALDLLPLDVAVARAARGGLLAFDDLGFDQRTGVEPAALRVPVDAGEDEDAAQERDGVVHGPRGDRPLRGHDEDDGYEERPDARPGVDDVAETTHVERSGLKFVGENLAEYGNAVRPVEGDGRDVEHTADGGVRAQPDQVDEDAAKNGNPDGPEGNLREAIDACPYPG